MGSQWELNGNYTGSQWELNGNSMGSQWELNGIPMGTQRDPTEPPYDPIPPFPPPPSPQIPHPFGVPHLHLPLQSRVGPQRGGHHLWGDGEVVGQPGAAAQQDGVHPIQVLRPEKRVVPPVLHHVVWGGTPKIREGALGDPKSTDVGWGTPKPRDPEAWMCGTPNVGEGGTPKPRDPKAWMCGTPNVGEGGTPKPTCQGHQDLDVGGPQNPETPKSDQ